MSETIMSSRSTISTLVPYKPKYLATSACTTSAFLSLANPIHTPECLKQWLLLLLQLVCLMLLYHQTRYLVYKSVIITLCECQFVSMFDLVTYVCTLYDYEM